MSIYVYQGSMPVPDPSGNYTIEKTAIPFRTVKSPRLTPQRFVLPVNNLTTPVRQVKPLITLRHRNRPMMPEDQGSPIQIATRRGFNGVGFGANKQHRSSGYPLMIWSGQSLFKHGVAQYLMDKPGIRPAESCTDCCSNCVETCMAANTPKDECRHNCSQGRIAGGCPGCECGHRSLCRGRACGRGLAGFFGGLFGLGDGGSPGTPDSSRSNPSDTSEYIPGSSLLDLFGFTPGKTSSSPRSASNNYSEYLPGSSLLTDLFGGGNTTQNTGGGTAKKCTPVLTAPNKDDASKCDLNWPIVGLIGVGLLALFAGGGAGKVIVVK